MRVILMLVAVATMILVTGCQKGSIRVSSPISVGPSGPTQVGLFIDENWSNPLKETKNVVNDRWAGVKWDETWAQSPDSINKIGKTTFNLLVYPSRTMFGDPGYEIFIIGEATEIAVYIGEADFGSKQDPKLAGKVQVTAPAGSRVAIVRWGEPFGPPAVLYLLEI